MFHVRVERTFCAAHRISVAGVSEAIHGHNWRVRVTLAGPRLDDDGLLVDFHEVERWLDEIIGPWHNASMNDFAPFDTTNPSAEAIAEFIGTSIADRMPAGGPAHVWSVGITEAPGCEASWFCDGAFFDSTEQA